MISPPLGVSPGSNERVFYFLFCPRTFLQIRGSLTDLSSIFCSVGTGFLHPGPPCSFKSRSPRPFSGVVLPSQVISLNLLFPLPVLPRPFISNNGSLLPDMVSYSSEVDAFEAPFFLPRCGSAMRPLLICFTSDPRERSRFFTWSILALLWVYASCPSLVLAPPHVCAGSGTLTNGFGSYLCSPPFAGRPFPLSLPPLPPPAFDFVVFDSISSSFLLHRVLSGK